MTASKTDTVIDRSFRDRESSSYFLFSINHLTSIKFTIIDNGNSKEHCFRILVLELIWSYFFQGTPFCKAGENVCNPEMV